MHLARPARRMLEHGSEKETQVLVNKHDLLYNETWSLATGLCHRAASRMSESDMSNCSETNWVMVDSLTDEAIDRSELPPLDESFFARATWRMPEKQAVVAVPVDPDLLAWFQAQGSESEQRMIAALRIYAEAHKDTVHQREPTAV